MREMEDTLEALVAISSPSGDVEAADRAVLVCERRLPIEATVERLQCSSPGHAGDMLARLAGSGHGRILLLGHLDTVVAHGDHLALEREGERWRGSGTIDMKGGVALALALMGWLAGRRELFAELGLLLVVDEEWRLAPFAHVGRLQAFDTCLCFEAGERASSGEECVIVRRKAAGTLEITARGRAAHAGSNPDSGANALVALADAARVAASLHDPQGAAGLSVVPSRIDSGGAINVVPAHGTMMVDVRANSEAAFAEVIRAIPATSRGATLEVELIRSWPGMDSRAACADLLGAASRRLGRPILGGSRGGASDASHFAGSIALTIDGLGPRGGRAHAPEEYVTVQSLSERLEIAMAICEAIPGVLA
jgi:glutamate carboxypeptidase